MADYLRDTVWEAYRENIVNRNNNNGQLPDNKGKRIRQAGSRYFCESLFWASQPKQAAKT
jgi:hypothetical protein